MGSNAWFVHESLHLRSDTTSRPDEEGMHCVSMISKKHMDQILRVVANAAPS